jgi:uncharacterized protein YoxC
MKEIYLYLGIAFVVFLYLYFQSNKYINELKTLEAEKRKELKHEIDKLKSERKEIENNINTLKEYIDTKDKQLNTNIQQINTKKNVQTRNVTDSSYNAILQFLLPK